MLESDTAPVNPVSTLPHASVALTTTVAMLLFCPVLTGWVVKINLEAITAITFNPLAEVAARKAALPEPNAENVVLAALKENPKSFPSTAPAPRGHFKERRKESVLFVPSVTTTFKPVNCIWLAVTVPLAINVVPSNNPIEKMASDHVVT